MTAHTGNAGPSWQRLWPSPRGRNAIDLPFTPAMAAAAARVLDEIRAGPARDSGRGASSHDRNVGGAPEVRRDAPPTARRDTRRNSRFPTDSTPRMTASA